jgi:hypothetical protein
MPSLFLFQICRFQSAKFSGAVRDADSMLAAGGGYTGGNVSTEENLPMTVLHIPAGQQGFSPLCRAHTFVLAHLSSFNCDAGDLRWTILALALHALDAASAFAQRQLARWARGVLRRAWRGARFAGELRHADSMVAAGGR